MGAKVRLTPWQISEIVACKRDPWHCLQNYVWLEREADMDVSIIPFDPYPKQKAILGFLLDRKNILANKSRRVGWSWIIAFFAWWLINFRKGIKVLFLSRTENDAAVLLDKVKFIHNNLAWRGDGDDHEMADSADWLTGEIVVSNKSEFARGFRNKAGQLSSKSTVVSLTNTDNSGRGLGATFALMDEFAFYDNDDLVWRSMSKTIIGGGFWACGSTPNSVGNKFHWLVANAEAGKNLVRGKKTYEYLTFHWSESWVPPEAVEFDKADSTSEDAFQEWELGFNSSGNTVFDPTDLAVCYKPPEEFPDVATEIKKYQKMLKQGHGYISAADTIQGKKHRKSTQKDWNAFSAFTQSGVQVHAYTDQESLGEWAGHHIMDRNDKRYWVLGTLSKLHAEFPGTLYIEEDGVGATAINNHDTPNDGFSQMLPFTSAGLGKSTAIKIAQTVIKAHQLVITDRETYNQLMVLQDNGPGPRRYEAPAGYDDDLAITICIICYALQEEGNRIFDWGSDASGPDRESFTGDLSSDAQKANLPFGPTTFIPEQLPGTERLADLVDGPGIVPVPLTPFDELDPTQDMMNRRMREVLSGPDEGMRQTELPE